MTKKTPITTTPIVFPLNFDLREIRNGAIEKRFMRPLWNIKVNISRLTRQL